MQSRSSHIVKCFSQDPDELSYKIAKLFIEANEKLSQPKAIFVPDAPLDISGPVASKAYLAIRPFEKDINSVVILAPAPAGKTQLYSCNFTSYETPLGHIACDREAIEELHSELIIDNPLLSQAPAIDNQLPFLQLCLNQFFLTPILVGDNAKQALFLALDKLHLPDTLIVISCDLHLQTEQVADKDQCALLTALTDQTDDPESNFQQVEFIKIISEYFQHKSFKFNLLDLQHSPAKNQNQQANLSYASFVIN